MNLVQLLVLTLACYRLSEMLANDKEDGPWFILSKFRHWVGVRYDDHSRAYGNNHWAEGLLCVYCNSMWFGILLAMLYVILGDIAVLLVSPFALSGAVVLATKFSSRG